MSRDPGQDPKPEAPRNENQPSPKTSEQHPDELRTYIIEKLKALVSIPQKLDEKIAKNEKLQVYYNRPEAQEELFELERERRMLIPEREQITEAIRPEVRKLTLAAAAMGMSSEDLRRAILGEGTQVEDNPPTRMDERAVSRLMQLLELVAEAKRNQAKAKEEAERAGAGKDSEPASPDATEQNTTQINTPTSPEARSSNLTASRIPEAETHRNKRGRLRDDKSRDLIAELRAKGIEKWPRIRDEVNRKLNQTKTAEAYRALWRTRDPERYRSEEN